MRMLLNYLNSQSQLSELLEELLCCLPITPKACQNISLFPFVSCALSLSDRTLRLAFLYDIVSLFPGEVGGGGSGPSATIDRFNQRRSTQKSDRRSGDRSERFSPVTAETMRRCGEKRDIKKHQLRCRTLWLTAQRKNTDNKGKKEYLFFVSHGSLAEDGHLGQRVLLQSL